MATCYRHPHRETNVSCSNCGKPICPDCMTTTPVGMRCPECAGQRTQVRNPIGAPSSSDAPATYALIAICVVAFIAEIATGGTISSGGGTVTNDGGLFAYFNNGGDPIGVAGGQPYRIVTSAFLHAGIFHIGFNMFALYILGNLIEPAIGTVRFVGIFAVAVLSGSFLVLVIDPNQLTVGASGGIFGLMGAAFLIARNRGLDQLASQIGFFVIINLVFTFGSSSISVGAHIGGLVGGALAAFFINQVERRGLPNAKAIEIAGLVALCVIAVAGALIAADSQVPPGA
jgi:membrane associated rhomboid family serine protease